MSLQNEHAETIDSRCKTCNVLLVGQIYLDTILHVSDFPEEDSKIRANYAEQRTGGNTCNTAEVLAQFHHINVCYMSAAGSRETSSHIVDLLKSKYIQVDDTFLYREDTTIPSSSIIHNEKSGSRTIISNNNIQDITCNEFIQTFEKLNTTNQWWVHFEGRNIDEAIRQIDWLNQKAIDEHWRDHLVISVELEKPERPDIELLIERGDIVFFSKIFAQHHGFTDAKSFLSTWDLLSKLKLSAKAFCTWGSKGASVIDNRSKQIHYATPSKIEKVVDTVGAGDTFNAGIILSLIDPSGDGEQLQKALQFACTLATKKVAQQGFENLCGI